MWNHIKRKLISILLKPRSSGFIPETGMRLWAVWAVPTLKVWQLWSDSRRPQFGSDHKPVEQQQHARSHHPDLPPPERWFDPAVLCSGQRDNWVAYWCEHQKILFFRCSEGATRSWEAAKDTHPRMPNYRSGILPSSWQILRRFAESTQIHQQTSSKEEPNLKKENCRVHNYHPWL